MLANSYLDRFNLSEELRSVLERCKGVCFPETHDELTELCYGPAHLDKFEVAYQIENKGRVVEATVVRCKNGPVVNYMEDYMRKRDPDCMRIADDLPTDKPRFKDVYGYDFEEYNEELDD